MEAGFAYAEKMEAGKAPNIAMKAAQKAWASDLRSGNLKHAFGGEDQLHLAVNVERFQEVSRQVFGPMLKCAKAGEK